MKFELENYNRNVPNDDLLNDLLSVSKKMNKSTLTRDEYDKLGKYSASTISNRFGSWKISLQRAGLDTKRKNDRLDKNKIIEDLKKVSQILHINTFTQSKYLEHGMYSVSAIVSKFGNWRNALIYAGLDSNRFYKLSNEELFQNIENIWTKLGRQPKYTEVEKPFSKFSGGTYERRFGSWRKSLVAFVNFMNQNDYLNVDLTNNQTQLINQPSLDVKQNSHKTKRDINWRLRFLVMRQDNFKCKQCGRSPATDPMIILHVDHIKPWAKGGETVFENLQTLCSLCNIGKSNL